jgi:hypothetical protein
MTGANGAVYYVRDQHYSYGPFSWEFLTSQQIPETITHIWYPGLPDWAPITRVLQVGPVTVQVSGAPVHVKPPASVRFGGRLWPK